MQGVGSDGGEVPVFEHDPLEHQLDADLAATQPRGQRGGRVLADQRGGG
jgi:hypothetical protein